MVAVVPAAFLEKQKSIVMKKLTIIIAALALFFSVSAFAPGPGEINLSNFFKVANVKAISATRVNSLVKDAFNQKYVEAQNVNWTQAENFYFASFDLKDNSFAVAYSEEGEFIAVARKVELTQIPMAAEEAIKEDFKDYVIPTMVNEIVLLGETHYYFTVEGKNAYLQLKCSPNGSISVEKRIKKKVLVGKVY
jgi:hypothetical protein